MTQSGFTSAVVNGLLGWLKGLARWVLRLFDLVGGASPLMFLANNWKKLLILMLLLGVLIDLVIWLVRWRPHWVWFRKKRVIVNDKNFFAKEAEFVPEEGHEARHRGKREMWKDEDYVVPSTMVQGRNRRRGQTLRPERTAQPRHRDVFREDGFDVHSKQKFTDKYESEVFDIDSLPDAQNAQPGKEASDHRRGGGREE